VNARLRRGLGAQGFAQLVQVVIRFAEVPLLLGCWGAELYGEWLIVSALAAGFVMADLGFTGTSNREMAMRASAGARRGAAALFRSTWLLLLAESLVFGTLAIAAAGLLPLREWLSLAALDARDVGLVASLLVASMLLGLQASLMNGGFWCEGRYASPMFISALGQLVEFSCLAAAAVLGAGPVGAAAAFLAGRVAAVAWMRLALRRASPWLAYGSSMASLAELRRLASASIASLAFPLGNTINLHGLRIVVGLALGPAAVAAFSSIRTLSRIAVQCTAVIARLLEPEMALAFGGSDAERVRLMLRRSTQAALWLGGAACLALAAFGAPFLAVWTHGQVTMEPVLFALLLCAALVYAAWGPALMVPYATNRHERIAIFYSLVYGFAAVGASALCIEWLGLVGAGVALLAAEIAVAAYVVPSAIRMSREPYGLRQAA
jgi:O-antigen/teichoic acid export membrane protein